MTDKYRGPAEVLPVKPVKAKKRTQSLVIGFTTAPRGKKGGHLQTCIDSLRDCGFTEEIHVFAEPGSPKAKGPGIHWHEHKTKQGCFKNWKHACSWLSRKTTEDWVLLLQDDVVWHADSYNVLMDSLEKFKNERVGFLSPYASPAMVPVLVRHDAKVGNKTGWVVPNPTRGFWGALTLCFSRDSIKALLASSVVKTYKQEKQVDVLVKRAFYSLKPRYECYIHVPSMAHHIGTVSTIGRHKLKGNEGLGVWKEVKMNDTPRVVDYETLVNCGPCDMDKAVMAAIKEGWQPLGGITGPDTEGWYYQTMVKYETKDELADI
jgi:hypothetical protein